MHPHQAQPELLKFCNEKGIILTAYSPTGYAGVREDPTVIKLAEKYNVSPAQISIAWHIARGTTAVPKSTDSGRQRGNLLVRQIIHGYVLYAVFLTLNIGATKIEWRGYRSAHQSP